MNSLWIYIQLCTEGIVRRHPSYRFGEPIRNRLNFFYRFSDFGQTGPFRALCRALETGVIKILMEAPSKKHNTRQKEMFYLPSITSATYFNSFWPRTTRALRGEWDLILLLFIFFSPCLWFEDKTAAWVTSSCHKIQQYYKIRQKKANL